MDPGELPEREASSKIRDDLICQAAAEGAVLLKNDNNVLPISKQSKVAVIGHHAETLTMHGGGSARIFPISSVNGLQGLDNAGIKYTYSRGVPVYNAVPLPDFDVVKPSFDDIPSPETPVRCQWFNSTKAGENYIRTTYLKRPEYMIKEAWPADLNQIDYSTRMEFSICPKTTGEHILGVTTTGEADVYVDGKHVYHREQEMDLIFETCKCFPSYNISADRQLTPSKRRLPQKHPHPPNNLPHAGRPILQNNPRIQGRLRRRTSTPPQNPTRLHDPPRRLLDPFLRSLLHPRQNLRRRRSRSNIRHRPCLRG